MTPKHAEGWAHFFRQAGEWLDNRIRVALDVLAGHDLPDPTVRYLLRRSDGMWLETLPSGWTAAGPAHALALNLFQARAVEAHHRELDTQGRRHASLAGGYSWACIPIVCVEDHEATTMVRFDRAGIVGANVAPNVQFVAGDAVVLNRTWEGRPRGSRGLVTAAGVFAHANGVERIGYTVEFGDALVVVPGDHVERA